MSKPVSPSEAGSDGPKAGRVEYYGVGPTGPFRLDLPKGDDVSYAFTVKKGTFKEFERKLPKGMNVLVVLKDPKDRARLSGFGLETKPYGQVVKGQKDFVLSGQAGRISQLLKTLNAGPNAKAYEPGAKARAILRGVEMTERDLADSGGAFELEDVQKLLRGVSAQAVSKRVREGSLLAVPGPSGRRRYPTVQFRSDGAVAPGLKEVAQAFPSRNPWMLLNFLVHKDPRLKTRPIDLLKQGKVEPVVAAAKAVGLQGG